MRTAVAYVSMTTSEHDALRFDSALDSAPSWQPAPRMELSIQKSNSGGELSITLTLDDVRRLVQRLNAEADAMELAAKVASQ